VEKSSKGLKWSIGKKVSTGEEAAVGREKTNLARPKEGGREGERTHRSDVLKIQSRGWGVMQEQTALGFSLKL